MKEIRAYLQPFMLARVAQALQEIPGFPGMSVMDCEGFGTGATDGSQDFQLFQPMKRVEIFVTDDLVEPVIGTLMAAATTHLHGAGKIYVLDALEGGRMRTGERGPNVV